MPLTRHEFQGIWNYTVHPQNRSSNFRAGPTCRSMNRRMSRNKVLADAGLIVGVSWVQPARLSAHPRLAGADPCLPTGWIIVCCRRYGAARVGS